MKHLQGVLLKNDKRSKQTALEVKQLVKREMLPEEMDDLKAKMNEAIANLETKVLMQIESLRTASKEELNGLEHSLKVFMNTKDV